MFQFFKNERLLVRSYNDGHIKLMTAANQLHDVLFFPFKSISVVILSGNCNTRPAILFPLLHYRPLRITLCVYNLTCRHLNQPILSTQFGRLLLYATTS